MFGNMGLAKTAFQRFIEAFSIKYFVCIYEKVFNFIIWENFQELIYLMFSKKFVGF
jgi:hypothetical protein